MANYLFLSGLGLLLAAPVSADGEAPPRPVASATTVGAVMVRRVADHWEFGVKGPGPACCRVSIDNKPALTIGANRAAPLRLSRGVHTIDIGPPIERRLMIRETGTGTLGSMPARVFNLAVPDPKSRRPATTIRIKQGDVIQIEWSSATSAEIHFHGYDIEGRVGPSAPLGMVFDANLAGRFGVEMHGHGNQPPFAFIEVYPR